MIQLAHLDNQSHDGRYHRYYYNLYPITVRLPAVGKRRATIKCGSRSQRVSCTIYSAAAARWRRRSRFVVSFLTLGCLTAVWYVSVHAHSVDWGFWYYPYWAVLILSSCFIVVSALVCPWISLDKCAVRLSYRTSHSLRFPGDTSSLG